MQRRRHSGEARMQAVVFLSDMLAIAAAYGTTLYLRLYSELGARLFGVINSLLGVRDSGDVGPGFIAFYTESAPRILFFLMATLGFLYAYAGLYERQRHLHDRPVAWNIVRANGIALMLFYSYFYLSQNRFHPRSMFFTILVLNALYSLLFRALVGRGLRAVRRRRGSGRCPAVLVGTTREADYLRGFLDVVQPEGIYVAAQVESQREGDAWPALAARIEAACEEHGADLLISADKRFDIPTIMQLLELTERRGIATKILSDKMNVLVNQARIPMELFQETPLVHFNPPPGEWTIRVSRALSVVAAAIALVALAPLLLLIAAVVRLTSPGPALFIQERIGFNRQSFRMFKFRTMHDRAEEMQAQVEEFNEAAGALFKIRNDPRVTPVGRILRRFSLDELPQLLNVVRREMNLVGPRPLPRRDFENYYEEWHYSRHGGRPGLTCLWQVSGRSEIDFHNMCILDVYYLRNRNVILDLKILLRTLGVVLLPKGAY